MPPRSRRAKLAGRPKQTGGASGGSTGKGKEDVFHFVNVNPTSETQKSENRSVIRSHASKYIWRQHRAVRADGAAGSSRQNPIIGSSSSSSNRSNRNPTTISPSVQPTVQSSSRAEMTIVPYGSSSYPEPAWKVSPFDMKSEETINSSPPLTTECNSYGEDVASSEGTESTESAVAVSPKDKMYASPANLVPGSSQNTVSGPFNQIMSWMEDPTRHSMLGESAISKLMRYAAFDIWPGLIPGADGQEWDRDAAAKIWLPRAVNSQALYMAFLYGAAGHMQTRKRLDGAQVTPQTREEKIEQIICENETITQLHKMMRDPEQSCSDEVILAVLCMAFNRTDYSSWSEPDSSPRAPLRNLQWLDVYGGLSLNDQHIKGLLALIEQRGGVYQVKLPGLAETLSVSAIMLSTKYLVKSRLPFVPIFKNSAKGHTPGWPSLEHSIELGLLGGDVLDPISKATLPNDLAQILRDMRDYNAVINLYCQGLLPKLGLAAIADRRNYIQYRLVALSAVHEFHTHFFETHKAYEPCRLAAMIYSMMVIFPLPAANRPFRRLSSLLKAALIESDVSTSWQGGPEMLLWVLILGGTAARDTPDQAWFVEVFRQTATALGITTFAQLKPILSTIIWMDSVCDVGAQQVWAEATHEASPAQ